MANFERYITFAGFVILIALTAAVLMPFQFDTGSRGLKAGAVTATFGLEILWFVLGTIVAFKRWRSTTSRFRLILALNGLAFVLIVVETFRELAAL
jgi:hypothetical protein